MRPESAAPGAPARHDLAWLAADAAASAQLAGPTGIGDDAARTLLAGWLRRGHPLIVTAQPAPAGATLRLGLALPPGEGKQRLAFAVPRACVRALTPPPALAEAAPALPARWQPLLRMLLAQPALAACTPRVFGSAAIQVATGEPCLGDASDLDLLLAPPDWAAAQAACAALEGAAAGGLAPRVDGEIRNARGEAVAWRELAGLSMRLLVKDATGARLSGRHEFAAGFAAGGARRAA